MEATTVVVAVSIATCGFAFVGGTVVPSLMEGRAVATALEAMARQPGVIDDIRTTLFVALAMLESCAIYALLICLILLFANPLLAYVK